MDFFTLKGPKKRLRVDKGLDSMNFDLKEDCNLKPELKGMKFYIKILLLRNVHLQINTERRK